MFKTVANFINKRILRYLEAPVLGYQSFSTVSTKGLAQTIQPGDILLVDGNLRISRIIKFLTQSSWSHAALYIGSEHGIEDDEGRVCDLVEADATRGVIAIPLSTYSGFNIRICRAKNLTNEDCTKLIGHAVERLGNQYDLKNAVDLMRYLIPYPPVPGYLRRRMIALGSGEATRAICSTLIAEAFQAIKYPILPEITRANAGEIYHIRHHSLYTPRDFDLSPYFQIIKPSLSDDFDHHLIEWEARHAHAPIQHKKP